MPRAIAVITVELPPDCRIGAQAAVMEHCLAALQAGGVMLDGSAVERVDTTALQLLMFFRRDMRAVNGSWSWTGASAVLQEAASLLGLAEVLEMPAVVPA